MRHVYLVSYDVCDAKRLRRTFKTMRRYGDHLQLSVFRCTLNDRDKTKMVSELKHILNGREDQVLLADLGPEEGRGSQVIESVGMPYVPPQRQAIVL